MSNLLFKIGNFNIRSMFTGFLEFKNLILQYDFDMVFLTETWLSDGDDVCIFNVPGYRFVHRDRDGRGGGVAVYFKNTYNPEIMSLDFTVTNFLEYLILKLRVKNKFYCFCVFYRPPNTNFNALINDFENIFSSIYPSVEQIICMGDFNINLLNEDNPLIPLFDNFNLVQIINQPTRICRNSASLLDPIFLTDDTVVQDVGTISLEGVSDHCLVYCYLKIEKVSVEPKLITYRNFNNFNAYAFYADLQFLDWNNIIYEQNIDNKILIFNQYLFSIFDKHAPFKTAKITKPWAPWLTPNIRVFIKQRDRALRDFKRTRAIEEWDNYKRLRNFTLSMIRREKRQYLNNTFAEKNLKKTWKTLKSLNVSSNKVTNIPTNLLDPNDISSFFREFLQTISDCSSKINYYKQNVFNRNLQFSFNFATVAEINKIINNISTNASGVDGVNAKMLKYCSPYIDVFIAHIINCCIEHNYFPDQWKISIGKPLPKVKNPTDISDLRIISILPVLSKVLEKVLYNQLIQYCNVNKIIPESQCGFRRELSTGVALVTVTDDIITSLDKKLSTALVLLDFSKAFDTINHELLLAKLKYFGFLDQSADIIRSYFQNRSQKIYSNNAFSEEVPILSGVPQGSILGPLLFIIYTSDILKSLKYCKVQAFADDTQVYFHFNHRDYLNASSLINHDINMLKKLSSEHNLKLNPLKSNVMIFGPKKEFLKSNLNIILGDVSLSGVDCAKNLGVVLDTELRFREYVKLLIKKSFLSLKILYNNRQILNFHMRKMLCESLVLSNFNYCDFIYGPCLDINDKNRIQKVQNTCSRLIFGLRKYDHISHTFKELNWLRMDSRRELHLANFLFKVIFNTSFPSVLKSKFITRLNIHLRTIRFSGKMTVPHHQTAMFQRSFTYNAIKVYNSLPTELTALSEQNFKKKFKQHLLSK